MHKVVVYSVPGTGTRFCNNFLEYVLGYTVAGRVEKLTEPKTYWQLHAGKNNLDHIMELHTDVKLLVPIRDPYLSYITRHHADRSGVYNMQRIRNNCIEYWEALIDYSTRYPTAFIPVDCAEDNRLRHLVMAANHLGEGPTEKLMQYADEWAAIGSLGMTDTKREYIERKTILGEKPTFLNFAVEWIDRLGLET
jgi:hypothetical protein